MALPPSSGILPRGGRLGTRKWFVKHFSLPIAVYLASSLSSAAAAAEATETESLHPFIRPPPSTAPSSTVRDRAMNSYEIDHPPTIIYWYVRFRNSRPESV